MLHNCKTLLKSYISRREILTEEKNRINSLLDGKRHELQIVTTELNSVGRADPTSYGTIESRFDFYTGWDEYLIVDSAIKMLLKEEADVTALLHQKNQLTERVITESQNRDAGEPQVVTDVVSYEQFYYA